MCVSRLLPDVYYEPTKAKKSKSLFMTWRALNDIAKKSNIIRNVNWDYEQMEIATIIKRGFQWSPMCVVNCNHHLHAHRSFKATCEEEDWKPFSMIQLYFLREHLSTQQYRIEAIDDRERVTTVI